jgi:sulfatase-like protein
MKIFFRIIAKTFWFTYLLLTSAYCICVFLPYTNYALIKAPPYPWIPWFAAHHAHLYWIAFIAAVFGYYQGPARRLRLTILGLWAVLGIALEAHPFITSLEGERMDFVWALLALLVTMPLTVLDVVGFWPRQIGAEIREWEYRKPLLWALAVATVGAGGFALRSRLAPEVLAVRTGGMELFAWSLISHAVLALVLVSLVNLVSRFAAKTPRPLLFRHLILLTATGLAASIGAFDFLENSFSFPHTEAIIFSIALTLALGVYILSIALIAKDKVRRPQKVWLRGGCFAALCLITACAVILPGYLAQWDWNGVLQRMLTFTEWATLAVAVALLPAQRRKYSTPALIAIILLALFGYKGLQATEIFWGKRLGTTDYEIGQTMGKYASEDFSFQVTHRLLGNAPEEFACADLCRILRAYTNVPPTRLSRPADLVQPLTQRPGPAPNIFIIVMDSMRPDYLGAYNPRVDFTPNMDAFARDSVVFRQAYSQYGGTTLSEPALWAGLMLLHSHYPQPFSLLNNLEKVVNANRYQMMVSYDTVLQQILSPGDDLVKLDTDKENWRSFDACTTVPQLANALDARADKRRPVFFYSQPMNVHQFARNNRPNWRTTSWRRPGFDPRISVAVKGADECLGAFFSMLKQRNLYDDSIIILTSDHGDATGAFGRSGHAISIYPEIMRVPLLVHVPRSLRGKLKYDDRELAALTDITPSLYYLLGYHDLQSGAMYGHSLFAETVEEVQRRRRRELFFASDMRAAYGLVVEDRFFYSIYDIGTPALYDLRQDPNGEHNVLTPELKQQYDQRVIEYLKLIGDFYGYKPGVSSLVMQRAIIP